MSTAHQISDYHSRIGSLGGKASTPAKKIAARLNAYKRWNTKPKVSILSASALADGVWYKGEGRNSAVGLWDAQAHCFWTIALNDFADPAHFPAKNRRVVRLKREEYFTAQGGTFKPFSVLHR